MANFLYHYNKNHDKLGRFTFSIKGYSSSVKKAYDKRNEKIEDDYDNKIISIYNSKPEYTSGYLSDAKLTKEDQRKLDEAGDEYERKLGESEKQYNEELARYKGSKQERKELEKELNEFYQMLPYSEMSSIATSGAFVSKVDPSLYPQLYAAVKAGEVACTGSFKKNMKDLSIDVFIDELSRKTPIAKIEREGEDWVLNYIEEEDARRVEQFNKYIDEQEKK